MRNLSYNKEEDKKVDVNVGFLVGLLILIIYAIILWNVPVAKITIGEVLVIIIGIWFLIPERKDKNVYRESKD